MKSRYKHNTHNATFGLAFAQDSTCVMLGSTAHFAVYNCQDREKNPTRNTSGGHCVGDITRL